MKKSILLVITGFTLLSFSSTSFGQVAPALGTASTFTLFTAVGAFDNVGPTVIFGNIGTNAGQFTGFPLGVITGGTSHVANTLSTQAATDVQAAFAYMSSIQCVVPLAVYGGPVNSPQVLTPNSYCVGAATTLAGNLILDAQNNPNALFFLRVSGALTTDEGSTVTLINGASAANVYWQVTGRVDLGRNSVMRGTLLTDGAINMIEGASLQGRGLSRAGAITLDTNTASLPVPTATYWLGSRTADWYTATNWSAGVPTSSLDAVVPTATSPYPVLAAGSAAAKSLTIGSSASFTQSGGTLDVKGSVDNSGTISASGGNVVLSGTAAQAVGGSGSTQFWSLTNANPAGTSQAGPLSIHGVLALTSSNLVTNGQPLTLLSDAAGTALVDNAGGVVNGSVTVQRYISPATNAGIGYRHYSSPVANATFNDLATTSFTPILNQAYNTMGSAATPFPNVFGYNEARVIDPANTVGAFDQGFLVPAGANLLPMTGYTVNIAANQTVDLTGALNNGPTTVTGLTRGTADQSGWQLLGNPYPSPIDFSQTSGVTRLNMDAAVYVYQSTGQYAGQYRSYVNGFGNPQLAVMQGFFTRVSANQTSGSLSLNNALRVTSLTAQPSFDRTTQDTRPLVQLRLQGTATPLTDDAYVYFEQGASAAYDAQYDAYKLPNSSGLSVGSMAATDELSVNGMALLTGANTVPLNVNVPAVGTYTLRAANLANFNAGTQVLLLDTQTGARINLNQQPTYTFQTAATALPGRFSLYFGPAGALANHNANLAAQVQLFPNPAHSSFTLVVPAELGRTAVQVSVLNQLGQVVREQTIALTAAGAATQFNVSGMAPGIYSLRLISGTTQVVKRLVVAQ
jgi:hypothetical protein